MSLDTKAKHYLNALKVKWMQLLDTPTIFAYTLNIKEKKFLEGDYSFYVELNEERSQLRRKPQVINSLSPKFLPKKFNFNKVNPLEVIMTIPYNGAETQLLINKSPLTKYHSLICPEVEKNLVQRLTAYSLEFSVKFLRHVDDKNCRIGYNSPGALASVNHLHLHLIEVSERLYIDSVELKNIPPHDYVFRLDEHMPTEAVCFWVHNEDSDAVIKMKVDQLYKLTEWLCAKNMPHNLFIAHDRQNGAQKNTLKIFLFARENYCEVKDLACFNVGFCESAGYIPIGDKTHMDELTEKIVIDKIREETGNAYSGIYEYLKNMK